MAMMAIADMPCATRSGAGAALAGGGAGVSLRQSPASVVIASQNATNTQVSGPGSCSMENSTPRNTNNGGAATASKAMVRARRCVTLGAANSPSVIAPSSATIGAAKASSKNNVAAADYRDGSGLLPLFADAPVSSK